MKKLLIIITLFVSSFFFISIEDAKAHEYTREVDFSLIEDTLSLKEKLDKYIENDTTLSDYYLIYSNAGNIEYYVFSNIESLPNIEILAYSTSLSVKSSSSAKKGSNLSMIYLNGTSAGPILSMHSSSSVSIILYSNFNILSNVTGHSITYNYQNFSHTDVLNEGSKLSTLYDLYIEYQKFTGDYVGPEENPHQEEIDKVTNFYTIVIEKISYLAEQISSNYILLFTIVIFIVTFVFLLIFRRFL